MFIVIRLSSRKAITKQLSICAIEVAKKLNKTHVKWNHLFIESIIPNIFFKDIHCNAMYDVYLCIERFLKSSLI